jgi:2,4-dienoyl-CoA reductase-like NADH-dependent reductase (Old Yellow Enzyme family)
VLFEPFSLHGVGFKNRLLRSSLGGRTSYYDGRVSPAWAQFERRFAELGVGGIVSATITVDERRWSPLEYPKISHDRFIAPLRAGVRAVQALDCRYILQLGDAGSHTQMGLFPQREDSKTASPGFDLVFGYGNRNLPMEAEEIAQVVRNFAAGAVRARAAGCDGIEIAAHKGYLIHQFLNPGVNRRQDAYGGSVDNRFRLLREIVVAVRRAVGADYLLGVRLSAIDGNSTPVNLRWPPVWPLRHFWRGNGLAETLHYGSELKKLGVDYLHITRGFGFPNPLENPGQWPVDEFRLYANATRHLSAKAAVRAVLLNVLPRALAKAIFGFGWRFDPDANTRAARAFKEGVGLPVVGNGGFCQREQIEQALTSGACDLVAMARPLLADPDLVRRFAAGEEGSARPCTHCNRCAVGTAIWPLGCFERSRFDSQDQMEAQILWWSGGPAESA